MDSKYSSFGSKNTEDKILKFSLKRKLPQNNVKVKKKKPNSCITNNTPKVVLPKPHQNGILVRANEEAKDTPTIALPKKLQNGVVKVDNIKESIQEFKKKLPVNTVRGRLLEEIKKHHTMIIIGETGSGKTTQIPQIVFNANLQGAQTIAITQPRRVAAITIALRVSQEMNNEIGKIVGYTVRFEDVTTSKTKIKYLTDGMLLREAMADPLLKKYSIIILDEAHERTVSTDVLFGIVKLAQKQRLEMQNPLKVIVMSATMDVDAFSKYFNNCPVIYLEGRTFPVTIYHSKTRHEDYQYAALCTIFQIHATAPADHDFLVFLTGQEEIETIMYNIKQIAKEAPGPQIKVCPLYAGLPPSKQLKVWQQAPSGVRKVILATNIAEASITIPQIKYVIDSGMVKERTWCPSTGAERLRVTACARAACWQRAGRAGREAPGSAYRLYTAHDFRARPAHNKPEVTRCPLAPTILLLVAVGVEPSTFPLMDAPPKEAVQSSLALLKELGAIDNESNPKLTVIGKKMAAFPIDPKYSKLILCANEFNCLEEILSIVAILSSENVFHNPLHKREEAARTKLKFISPLGDHITMLNVFKAFSKTTLKKQWCKENYLNHRNLQYATEVREQLYNICQRFDLTVNTCGDSMDQVLKCMLTGLSSQCAWLRAAESGPAKYVTKSGITASIHPQSCLHTSRPPVVLYADLIHSRRIFLHTVSALRPQWLTNAR